MGENYFDLITHEVYKLKERREHLENENSALRQQLTDLRSGRGIFVEIEGKRFPLITPVTSTTSLSTPLDQEHVTSLNRPTDNSSSTSLPIVSAQSLVTAPLEEEQPASFAEQTEDEPEASEDQEASGAVITKELEIPVMAHAHSSLELSEEDITSSFLEEALIDEFTSAATSPLAVWSGPPTTSPSPTAKPSAAKTQQEIDEEEKAALREQLIGSFLLE